MSAPPIVSLESESQLSDTATGIRKLDGKQKASPDPKHPIQQLARKSQQQPKPSIIIQEELEIQQEFTDQKNEPRTCLSQTQV